MRQFLVIATAAAVLAPALATSAEPVPPPLRMPGLWLLNTQIVGTPERARDYHYCVAPCKDHVPRGVFLMDGDDGVGNRSVSQ